MKKNAISAVLTICAALGWWGALYPEFTLLAGTYEIVYEEDEARDEENASESDGGALYWDILNADSRHIRFKSRVLTDWKTLQEQRREVHESGEQQ